MDIIDQDGRYQYLEGTRTLKKSDHPVFMARIELALGQNTWCYAPSAGHDFAKYQRAKQSTGKLQEFQKDLAFYLEKYGPELTQLLINRRAISIDLSIAKDALNV